MSRQNWSEECEKLINEQINLELSAYHYYLKLYCFFSKSTINMPKIANFFKKSSDEEKEHAEQFMDYQNLRGGNIEIKTVSSNILNISEENSKYQCLIEAFKSILELEKKVNSSILNIHSKADPHLSDFLESNFIDEQVKANDEIYRIINDIKFIGESKYDLYSYISNFSK